MPIIPFNMPRNDMLSFAGDEHHFHILGFSWSTGSPELSLLPLRRDGNDLTGDRTPFDIDLRDMDDISFRFSGPPVCIGRFEEGEHIPCPGTREVNRFSQCMECMTHDIPDPNCIFEPHCHTGPCGADFCQVEHVVYITAFRSRMKIGMTQHRRMRTRAMEQGADGMLPLIILKDRFSARSYEGAISRTLGLPQMVSSYEKVQSTTMKRDLNEISEDLLQIKEELKMFWDDIEKRSHPKAYLVKGPDELELEPIMIDDYPLEEPLPSKPKRFKGERIRGNIIGVKGNHLFFRQGGLFAYRIGATPGMVLHSDIDLSSIK